MINKILGKYLFISMYIAIQFSMVCANPEDKKSEISNQADDGYIFKPGDGLYISTFPDTTSFLNQIFPIDDTGYVEFPILGRVKIVDMKKGEIISFIRNNFQQYIHSPYISIKPMCRISILGGVPYPGLFYLDYNTTFWSAIQQVGGTTHETGLKKMSWERNRKEISGNIIPYFEKGMTLKSMGVKSGDQFSTPFRHETFWDRFVSIGMPLITFGTTVVFFYFTYQQNLYIARSHLR